MKKRNIILLFTFLILLLTGCSRGDGKKSDEVDALEDIIATQRENGATVSEDINNKEQYTWSKDGHLIELKWGYDMTDDPVNPIDYKLTGGLSLSSFPQLSRIECRGNKLTDLDMSGCKKIKYLSCEMNKIKSLDVHDMKDLEYLVCYQNPLTKLDVTSCSKLISLAISSTKITNIDLSKCSKLEKLDCYSMELEEINLRNNPQLRTLDCFEGKLTSLDLRQNSKLERLSCSDNRLGSLDLSQNEKLNYLSCANNKLKSLKVSSKANIETFHYYNNPIPLSDFYAVIVPSSKEKKRINTEKAAEKMKDYMDYTEKVKKNPDDYKKLTLKNGVEISPNYTFTKEGKSSLTIDFVHPQNMFDAKYGKIDGDGIIDSEYMESFSEIMAQRKAIQTIVSYQFTNSKGDCFKQKAKYIVELPDYTDKNYTAQAFLDKRGSQKKYAKYKGNLEKLNKVFSDHGTIKLTLKYKKGSYTYKLNEYQIREMRLMLDFCKEGQSYIR